jgi:hypothetical protein
LAPAIVADQQRARDAAVLNLEDIKKDAQVQGLDPSGIARVVTVEPVGPDALTVYYKTAAGVLTHLCQPCPACRVFSMSWSFFAAGLVTTFEKPRREDR